MEVDVEAASHLLRIGDLMEMDLQEAMARSFATNLVLTAICRLNLLLIVRTTQPVGLKELMNEQREGLLAQVKGLPLDESMIQTMLGAVKGEFAIYEKVVKEFGEHPNGSLPL